MEMFIDSYDWVMVPNVYGMSQFADGGSDGDKALYKFIKLCQKDE
jgi:deoxyribodipyrimidine photolyase-related protein